MRDAHFKRPHDLFYAHASGKYFTVSKVTEKGVVLFESDRRGQPMNGVEVTIDGPIELLMTFENGPTVDAIRKEARSKR